MKKNKKKISKENQKIYSSEKKIQGRLENGQRLVEEVKKYKDWNLTIYFLLIKALLTKKIQFEEEKSKIRYLRTQLDFVERLIEFMKGLIARKIDF